MYEFPSTGPIVANLHVNAGNLRVIAEERDSVQVSVEPVRDTDADRTAADNTRVEMNGNTLTVETPNARGFGFIRRGANLDIMIRMPIDSELSANSASADMTFDGRYASATIKGASGDLRLEDVTGNLERHSASGDSEIGRVGGDASITKASGDLRVAAVGGDLAIKSASGDITVGPVGASARVSTASGDIRIDSLSQGEARLTSASGDVHIGVAEGTAVWLDLNSASGDSRSELPVSDASPTGLAPTLTLHVRTASGDITVHRAPQTETFTASTPVDLLQD